MAHPRRQGSLVGRDAELSRLRDWVVELAAGRGRAVLVEGEPGIGKSALVAAACADATAHGCRVLRGGADELGQGFALLPLLDALGDADGRWRLDVQKLLHGGPDSPLYGANAVAAASERLLATIDELCALSPVMLAIDDLHWADAATLRIWSRLARAVNQLPLLLIATARPIPRRDELVMLRGLIPRGDVLRLQGLGEDDIRALVTEECGGLPGAGLMKLASGAGGNPLYLGELLASLRDGGGLQTAIEVVDIAEGRLPTTVGEAIVDRLRFLSAEVRRVLGFAALLGVEFSVEDLATVSTTALPDMMPALHEARVSGVLTEGREGLAFRHPLIRTALYDEMPAAVRAAWHRGAARSLAEDGAPAVRVARQLLPASQAIGDGGPTPLDDWAIDWITVNATALTSQAPEVAVTLLSRAAAVIPAASPHRAVLAARLATALLWIGDIKQAEQAARNGLEYASDLDLLVELYETVSYCQSRTGHHREALAMLAIAIEDPLLDVAHRCRLRVLIARQWVAQGRLAAAEDAARQALAEAPPGNRWVQGWALMTLADAGSMAGAADALAQFDQALTVIDGDPSLTGLRLLTMANKVDELVSLDRLAEADHTAQQVRRLAADTGNMLRVAQAQATLGIILFYSGRWDDALAETESPAAGGYFSHEPYVRGMAATIALHRGQVAVARGHLKTADAYAEKIGAAPLNLHILAQILLHEHSNDIDAALQLITASLDAATDDIGSVEDWLTEAVRIAMVAGDLQLADRATAMATAIGRLGTVAHRRGIALHCQGLRDRDPAMLSEAAEQYREAGWVLLRSQAIEASAIAIGRDLTAMRSRFTEAFDLYGGLGAAFDLARLSAELRGRGIRRGAHGSRRRPSHGWESLTPTEVNIARLVGEGLSNPQIAEQLFLSRRTVQTHVSHVLTKLDQHSRVDIAVEATRRHPPKH